ncbi:MAG: hypothetical protein AVDCRST_MAG53-2331, partial [uncultured Solirubrobacteraceae bacterium]
ARCLRHPTAPGGRRPRRCGPRGVRRPDRPRAAVAAPAGLDGRPGRARRRGDRGTRAGHRHGMDERGQAGRRRSADRGADAPAPRTGAHAARSAGGQGIRVGRRPAAAADPSRRLGRRPARHRRLRGRRRRSGARARAGRRGRRGARGPHLLPASGLSLGDGHPAGLHRAL